METANQRLRRIRIQRKFATADDAAKFLQVKIDTYRQHENDTRNLGGIPRKAAEHYAAKFKVSLDWLMTGKGDEPVDTLPTADVFEEIVRDVLAKEVTVETRLADLPSIIAPALLARLDALAGGTVVRLNRPRAPGAVHNELGGEDASPARRFTK